VIVQSTLFKKVKDRSMDDQTGGNQTVTVNCKWCIMHYSQ